jgi:hypothetical protein
VRFNGFNEKLFQPILQKLTHLLLQFNFSTLKSECKQSTKFPRYQMTQQQDPTLIIIQFKIVAFSVNPREEGHL